MKKEYFVPPKNENGKEIWVPVVVKNRDYLLGYIDAFCHTYNMYDIDYDNMNIPLASDRLNDILVDGSRVRNLDKKELKTLLEKLVFVFEGEHIENSEEILNEYIFSIECPDCGWFHGFKKRNELPYKNLKCYCCNRPILIYTYKNDNMFIYDGDKKKVERLIGEVTDEILGNN